VILCGGPVKIREDLKVKHISVPRQTRPSRS
jgi:hypothetical protein